MKILLRVVIVSWLLSLGSVYAFDQQEAFSDGSLQERYLTLTHELRCVVCQNQSIADSNADLAADLRRQVRELIGQGQSDEQIKSYLTARYGDYILYDPPFNRRSAILWLAPMVLLIVGFGIIVRIIRARAQNLVDSSSP